MDCASSMSIPSSDGPSPSSSSSSFSSTDGSEAREGSEGASELVARPAFSSEMQFSKYRKYSMLA